MAMLLPEIEQLNRKAKPPASRDRPPAEPDPTPKNRTQEDFRGKTDGL
jgi:hypothetical protein